VALAALGVGLFVWKSRSAQPTVTQQTVTVTATTPKAPDVPPPLFAPPPPPKIEEEPDAGVDAGKEAPKGGGPAAPGPGPCGGPCSGQATGPLQSALTSRARSAQGCYNRALRTSEVSGSITVSVQVGPSGQVCSASLAADSVHSNEITSCVLGRFRGQTFPPPTGGCVTVNIPISFTIKQ
jgi:TonB family protein